MEGDPVVTRRLTFRSRTVTVCRPVFMAPVRQAQAIQRDNVIGAVPVSYAGGPARSRV